MEVPGITSESLQGDIHRLFSLSMCGDLSLRQLVEQGRVEEIQLLCRTELAQPCLLQRGSGVSGIHAGVFLKGETDPSFPCQVQAEDDPNVLVSKTPIVPSTILFPEGYTIPELLLICGHLNQALQFIQDDTLSPEERLFLLTHHQPSLAHREMTTLKRQAVVSSRRSFDVRVGVSGLRGKETLSEWLSTDATVHGTGLFHLAVLHNHEGLLDWYCSSDDGQAALQELFCRVPLHTAHPLVNVLLKSDPTRFQALCHAFCLDLPAPEGITHVLSLPVLGSGVPLLRGKSRGSNPSPLLLHLLLDLPPLCESLFQQSQMFIPYHLMGETFLSGSCEEGGHAVRFCSGWDQLLSHLRTPDHQEVHMMMISNVLVRCTDIGEYPLLRERAGRVPLMYDGFCRMRARSLLWNQSHFVPHLLQAIQDVLFRVDHSTPSLVVALSQMMGALHCLLLSSGITREPRKEATPRERFSFTIAREVKEERSQEERENEQEDYHRLVDIAGKALDVLHDPDACFWDRCGSAIYDCVKIMREDVEEWEKEWRPVLRLASPDACERVRSALQRILSPASPPTILFGSVSLEGKDVLDTELQRMTAEEATKALFGETETRE